MVPWQSHFQVPLLLIPVDLKGEERGNKFNHSMQLHGYRIALIEGIYWTELDLVSKNSVVFFRNCLTMRWTVMMSGKKRNLEKVCPTVR